MCIATESQIDQAIGWMYDDIMDLVGHGAPEYLIESAINDLVHLENMTKGKIGYEPDLNFDFQIGL